MKILCILFSLLFVNISGEDCLSNKINSKLVCYYSKVKDIDNCKCSHIVLPWNSNVKSLNRIKSKTNGVKILVTVNEFNEALVNLFKNGTVDGLEINLRKIGSKNDVSDMISTVRNKLGSDLYVALSIPPKPNLLAKFYDFKLLSKITDLFILQTDFLGVSKNVTFHPSRLSGIWDMQNADSLVDLVNGLGAPYSKLVLTSPVQAFKFTLQNEDDTAPGSPAIDISTLTREELCNKISISNWTLERDQDQAGPFIFRKKEWIAFDDSTSIDIKAKYSRVRGLAGLALKDISQDGGIQCGGSLLDAAFSGLSKQARAPRSAILQSLEREILEIPSDSLHNVHVSPYRISRIIDVEGKIHIVRQDTRTEFECSRQGYFIHPRSCGRFYRCVKFNQLSDEFNVFEFDCPNGLAFDDRYEVCVWPGSLPHTSACTGSSEIAPVPRQRFTCPSEPGYYADPENCRWFFACLDEGNTTLTAYEFRCPFGLIFNEKHLICDWPWLVPNCAWNSGTGILENNYESSQILYGDTNLVDSDHFNLDYYNGLGSLVTVPLGGITEAVEKPITKIYSSIGANQGVLFNIDNADISNLRVNNRGIQSDEGYQNFNINDSIFNRDSDNIVVQNSGFHIDRLTKPVVNSVGRNSNKLTKLNVLHVSPENLNKNNIQFTYPPLQYAERQGSVKYNGNGQLYANDNNNYQILNLLPYGHINAGKLLNGEKITSLDQIENNNQRNFQSSVSYQTNYDDRKSELDNFQSSAIQSHFADGVRNVFDLNEQKPIEYYDHSAVIDSSLDQLKESIHRIEDQKSTLPYANKAEEIVYHDNLSKNTEQHSSEFQKNNNEQLTGNSNVYVGHGNQETYKNTAFDVPSDTISNYQTKIVYHDNLNSNTEQHSSAFQKNAGNSNVYVEHLRSAEKVLETKNKLPGIQQHINYGNQETYKHTAFGVPSDTVSTYQTEIVYHDNLNHNTEQHSSEFQKNTGNNNVYVEHLRNGEKVPVIKNNLPGIQQHINYGNQETYKHTAFGVPSDTVSNYQTEIIYHDNLNDNTEQYSSGFQKNTANSNVYLEHLRSAEKVSETNNNVPGIQQHINYGNQETYKSTPFGTPSDTVSNYQREIVYHDNLNDNTEQHNSRFQKNNNEQLSGNSNVYVGRLRSTEKDLESKDNLPGTQQHINYGNRETYKNSAHIPISIETNIPVLHSLELPTVTSLIHSEDYSDSSITQHNIQSSNNNEFFQLNIDDKKEHLYKTAPPILPVSNTRYNDYKQSGVVPSVTGIIDTTPRKTNDEIGISLENQNTEHLQSQTFEFVQPAFEETVLKNGNKPTLVSTTLYQEPISQTVSDRYEDSKKAAAVEDKPYSEFSFGVTIPDEQITNLDNVQPIVSFQKPVADFNSEYINNFTHHFDDEQNTQHVQTILHDIFDQTLKTIHNESANVNSYHYRNSNNLNSNKYHQPSIQHIKEPISAIINYKYLEPSEKPFIATKAYVTGNERQIHQGIDNTQRTQTNFAFIEEPGTFVSSTPSYENRHFSTLLNDYSTTSKPFSYNNPIKNIDVYGDKHDSSSALKTSSISGDTVVTQSPPISRYSFSSFDQNFNKYVSSSTPTTYVHDNNNFSNFDFNTHKTLIHTNGEYKDYLSSVENKNNYIPTSTPMSYIAKNNNDVIVVKAATKPIIKVNDFHPLLTTKLGAQCTCVSDNFKLRGNPALSYDDDITEYISGNNEFSTYANIEDDTLVRVVQPKEIYSITSEDYQYNSPKKTQITVKDISSTSQKNSYSKVFESKLRSNISFSNDKERDNINSKYIAEGPPKELLSKSTLKQITTEDLAERTFDRYGPGGLRSRKEYLQGTIDCQRAGLFRHPEHCNKFYSCRWDCNKKKFTLHVFNCPVHLTFDNNLGACNWPSHGPTCVGNTLLPSD